MFSMYVFFHVVFLSNFAYGQCPMWEYIAPKSKPVKCQEAWGFPDTTDTSKYHPDCDTAEEKVQCVCMEHLAFGHELKRLFISDKRRAPCVTATYRFNRCREGMDDGDEVYIGDAVFPVQCQEWCPGFGYATSQCTKKFTSPGCQCKDGLVRAPPDGECQTPEACIALCPRQNEEPRERSNKELCENTCSGYSYCPRQPSPCICKSGYIRTNPQGLCVARTICLPEQEITTCASRCGKFNARRRMVASIYRPFPYHSPFYIPLSPPSLFNRDSQTPFVACSCDLRCVIAGDCCSDFITECPSECPCQSLQRCHCYYSVRVNNHYVTQSQAERYCGCRSPSP